MTALIVVDMQNSFLDPNGENAYPEATAVVPHINALLATARAANRLVVHTADRHRPGFADFEHKKLPTHCVSDDFNADYFAGFGPKAGAHEVEIVKRRYSAFFATDLALFLREQAIERTVICGIKTNCCVRATAQDAFAHGFEVVVPREATNSNRPHLADASLEDIDRYMGRVVSLAEAEKLLG